MKEQKDLNKKKLDVNITDSFSAILNRNCLTKHSSNLKGPQVTSFPAKRKHRFILKVRYDIFVSFSTPLQFMNLSLESSVFTRPGGIFYGAKDFISPVVPFKEALANKCPALQIRL